MGAGGSRDRSVMDRRSFLAAALALAAVPRAAEAQPAGVPRIGVLVPGNPTPGTLPLQVFDAFRQGLRDLGYVEGRTIVKWTGAPFIGSLVLGSLAVPHAALAAPTRTGVQTRATVSLY